MRTKTAFERTSEVMRRRALGMTLREIGDAMGYSAAHIRTVLERQEQKRLGMVARAERAERMAKLKAAFALGAA